MPLPTRSHKPSPAAWRGLSICRSIIERMGTDWGGGERAEGAQAYFSLLRRREAVVT